MKSSYRIAKIFGISVELHITFILFFLFLFLIYWVQGGLISGLGILILFFLIFTIVLLHELTHSLVAIKNGIKVPKITLLPIGGLASVEIPQKPEKELMIAISGPLLNFLIAFISAVILVSIAQNPVGIFLDSVEKMWDDIPTVIFSLPGILSVLVWINLMLGFFNILPGFPMDGGRVFRAILALWMDYVKATEISVRIGQVIFLGMVFIGLFSNFWLVIIGTFLFFASGSELNMAKIRQSLHEMRVGAIAIRNFSYVSQTMKISDFLRLIAKPEQRYYPTVNSEGNVAGILDIQDLEGMREEDFFRVYVKNLAKGFEIIDANLKVEKKIQDLLSKDFLLVISENKQVLGYLTPEYVLEFARFYGISHKR